MNKTLKILGSLTAGITLCGLGIASLAGQTPAIKTANTQEAEFFETKVRPLLSEKCFSCHGTSQQQGGIRLDAMEHALKGNSDGIAVVPGEPDKSLLVRVIGYAGKVKMPPTGKLKPEEIKALTAWVKMGAPWPGAKVSDAALKAAKTGEYVITEAQRKFWSFQPVRKPLLPAVKNKAWCANPIDVFVLARLEKKGLTPNPKADRRTLIRRAYYDILGLPPTALENENFVADKSPDAWPKLIDRLLASPHYGERWGRYWLDVARYADTRGYVFTEDRVYHNAYTFRDYVIRAFNDDRPYDRFVKEQIAADKMDLGEDKRPLAAMGFLTIGRRFLNNPHDIIDDRIDVTMRGFQGLTVGCARCHDHKFDPIPTKDYYALYGVFASSTEPDPPPGISPKDITAPYEAQSNKIIAAGKEADTIARAQIAILRQKVEKTPEAVTAPTKAILQKVYVKKLPEDKDLVKLIPEFDADARKQIEVLRANIAEWKAHMPQTPEFAMTMTDLPTPVNPAVFKRGNPNNRGDSVNRHFVRIVSGDDPKPFAQGSGRLELSDAIASKDNPLTARVMVNRVWLGHFGLGIVRTPSDFGTRGEPPTHPELLDWLAAEFQSERLGEWEKDKTGHFECGWSVKRLHRLIMLSNTYQQSSICDNARFAADPENRLISRMNRRRLDLEALRDSLLFVAGKLDQTVGGKSVELTTQPFSTRRTVYGFIDRQNLQGMYRTFDFASPDTSSPQRYRTTVPQQALFMMNSPFIVEQAKALAHRKDITDLSDDTVRLRAMYKSVLGREPDKNELAAGLRFVQRPDTRSASLTLVSSQAKPNTSLDPWEEFVQVLMMTNEFAYVD